MRFVNRAGLGLLLACAPLTGVGCASLSPRMSSIPLMARKMAAADQYRTALHAEQKQDYNAARDQYALLQKEFPNDAVYAHRMGVVCTQLGEYATAEKYFEHARKLEPGNLVLLTDMGYSAIVQKEYARAEALLDAAVRLKPDDSRALNNLAMAVGFQGRFDESLTLFNKINGESQALVNVAYIHTQRAERQQAIACYRRAMQLDPNNKLATESLAKLVSAPSNTAVAATAPQPRLKKQPDRVEAVPKSAEEQPLVKHVAAAKTHPRATAARPRDRVSDEQELPFFEDGENVARSIASAYEKSSAIASRDSDKPVIVPEESFVRPAVTPPPKNKVAKSTTRPRAAEPTQAAAPMRDEVPIQVAAPVRDVASARVATPTRKAESTRATAPTREVAPIHAATEVHDEVATQAAEPTLIAVPETDVSPTRMESTDQVAPTPKVAARVRSENIVPVVATAQRSTPKPSLIPEPVAAPELIEFDEPIASSDNSLEENASPAFATAPTPVAEPVLEEELILPEELEDAIPVVPVPVAQTPVVPKSAVRETVVAKAVVPVPVIPEPALTLPPAAEKEAEVATATRESEVASLVEPGPPLNAKNEPIIQQTKKIDDFGLDESSPASKRADSEDLTALDWVKEQQAELLTAGSGVTESELLEADDGLKGYCPVAIRDERRLVVALDEFACEHQGQTYRFYSTEALEKFQAHPEQYAPIAGGLDIVAVRKGESVFNGTLDFAVWYRHRLHLFSNSENLAAFRAAPRTFASVP